MSDIQKYGDKTFEEIKHINEYGNEYWLARDLALVLEYVQWRNFLGVIQKAKEACVNSGFDVDDHFADVSKMVEIGSNTQREIEDIELSRYACIFNCIKCRPEKESCSVGQVYMK